MAPLGLLLADDSSQPAEIARTFSDLDGDGFDDAIEDQDGDGIPEKTTMDQQESASAPASDNMFASVQLLKATVPVFLHNSGTFNHLRRQLTALVQHRGGFSIGAEFGPGSDIGSGAVLGGACAGGACTPR